MKSKSVSIVIPTYNRERIILETITSALNQDYDNFEVVVVDNASTDNTWTILTEVASADPRLKIFRNSTNLGPVRNWMEAIKRATGEYTKILWSDDLISSNFLTASAPFLADPTVGFVFTAARIFSVHPDTGQLNYLSMAAGKQNSKAFIEGHLRAKNIPCSPGCAIFRTSDALNSLKIDIPNSINSDFSAHAIGNDLLMLLLIANSYEHIVCLQEPLAQFRSHEGSISVEATRGKILVHYDLAKAYFVQEHLGDSYLKSVFNSHLAIDRWRHKADRFGINRVSDFYPRPERLRYDFSTLVSQAVEAFYLDFIRPHVLRRKP